MLFDGGYADHVLTARRMQATHVESGARATGAGTIAIVDNGPRLDLSGRWEQFRWPLVGREPPVRSAAGTFTLQGVLPYRVHVTGDVRAAALAPLPVDVYGSLGKDRFSFERAEVDLYGGHTSAHGEVVWSGPGSWDISGRATGINPGLPRRSAGQPELQLHDHGQRLRRAGQAGGPPRSPILRASCAVPPQAGRASPTTAVRSSSATCG